MREGEGISQRTNVHDPQTQTPVWGGRREGGGGWEEVSRRGEMGTSVKVSTVTMKLKFFENNLSPSKISIFFLYGDSVHSCFLEHNYCEFKLSSAFWCSVCE